MQFLNGGVYKRGIWTFTLVQGIRGWCMLHLHRSVRKGMTAPQFQHGQYGVFDFTEAELCQEWDAANWQLLDGRLRIQKIDDDTFTEYPLGNLIPMESIEAGE